MKETQFFEFIFFENDLKIVQKLLGILEKFKKHGYFLKNYLKYFYFNLIYF